jgi:hypothetical protein
MRDDFGSAASRKIAIVMLAGRFRKPRATITSDRMFSVKQRPLGPRGFTAQRPPRSWLRLRGPKSLSKLSKIIRGFPTTSVYDKTGRLLRAFNHIQPIPEVAKIIEKNLLSLGDCSWTSR